MGLAATGSPIAPLIQSENHDACRKNSRRADDNVVNIKIIGREIVVYMFAFQGELIQGPADDQFAFIA